MHEKRKSMECLEMNGPIRICLLPDSWRGPWLSIRIHPLSHTRSCGSRRLFETTPQLSRRARRHPQLPLTPVYQDLRSCPASGFATCVDYISRPHIQRNQPRARLVALLRRSTRVRSMNRGRLIRRVTREVSCLQLLWVSWRARLFEGGV